MDLKGTNQKLNYEKTRVRSAAYPFELAYRLINMFSIKDDIILDPFLGTGTSSLAAMISERNSIGYEIDFKFKEIIENRINNLRDFANSYIDDRINSHVNFINNRIEKKGTTKHHNEIYNFPVVTSQEKTIKINKVKDLNQVSDNEYKVSYYINDYDNLEGAISIEMPIFKKETISPTQENDSLKTKNSVKEV